MRYTGCSSVSPQRTLRAEPFSPAAVTSRPWPLQLTWKDRCGETQLCGSTALAFLPAPSPFLLAQASPLLVLSCSSSQGSRNWAHPHKHQPQPSLWQDAHVAR